jgi:hypothetical protein
MSTCIRCNARLRCLSCAHCLATLYCSTACRTAHWPSHDCISGGNTFNLLKQKFVRLLRYLAELTPAEETEVLGAHLLNMSELQETGVVTWVFHPMNDIAARGVSNRNWARVLSQIAIQSGEVYGAVDADGTTLICSFIFMQ